MHDGTWKNLAEFANSEIMPMEAVGLPSIDGMKFFGANNHGAKKIEMLKNIPIFQTLTRNQLLEMDELLHKRTCETGEIVFEKGEMGRNKMSGEFALFDEVPRLVTVMTGQ